MFGTSYIFKPFDIIKTTTKYLKTAYVQTV